MFPLADVAAHLSIIQAVLEYLVAPMLPLLGAGLLALIAKLVLLIHAQEKNSKAIAAVGTVAEAAKSIVAELEVTMRPELQKDLEDGTLTPEEGAKLKAMAIDQLKSQLPASVLKATQGIFGGLLDTWLGGIVERANAAQGDATVPPPSTTEAGPQG